MKIRSIIFAAAALCAGILSGTTAFAEEARATSSVNVRSGPGASYSIVDALRAGEIVDVSGCTGGWCRITHSGPDGWVSANYLTLQGGSYRPSPSRPSPSNPDIGFCIDAPNFSFGVNCDEDDDDFRPGRPGGYASVCFYEDANFRGDRFCARPGTSDRSLSAGWNDRISSIQIRGGATATVCEDFNYRNCYRVTRDIRSLGSRTNDEISSYRVR